MNGPLGCSTAMVPYQNGRIILIYLIYDFLAGYNYPASPYSQGGMKFATQISLLLNLQISFIFYTFSLDDAHESM